ncbi:ribosome small subunit-dependent GTPase A [Salsuginibacillus kocurii]|uniref:ribosome small subunit-dependent GTPase A n=1 Tax=Salsuginibacillus kocurii TaxID=427078 RepID=UPI0003815C08|nr:ribosome small subunit-dependent GTPase A [Salsuginibacillus kocurii]
MAEGKIVKAVGGFFYVENETGRYQCRARGLFRKKKEKPLVGDEVIFEAETIEEGYVLEIKARFNKLTRPPIANVEQALIVCSAVSPDFSPWLLDRMLVHVEAKDIEPILLFTKRDQCNEEKYEQMKGYQQLYESLEYPVYFVSHTDEEDLDQVATAFAGKVTVLAGASGVGKSSFLNRISPGLDLEVGEISKQLKRGKHTTRHVELLSVQGGQVADTPGFSALDFENIQPEELTLYFPEMRERRSACKFRECTHRKEPACAIKEAVEQAEISRERYEHYLSFYEEIVKQTSWR